MVVVLFGKPANRPKHIKSPCPIKLLLMQLHKAQDTLKITKGIDNSKNDSVLGDGHLQDFARTLLKLISFYYQLHRKNESLIQLFSLFLHAHGFTNHLNNMFIFIFPF